MTRIYLLIAFFAFLFLHIMIVVKILLCKKDIQEKHQREIERLTALKLRETYDEIYKDAIAGRFKPTLPQFTAIKDARPTEGAHIFVWDAVERKAIPTQYLGTQEAWKASKDHEKRHTHYIELEAPDLVNWQSRQSPS